MEHVASEPVECKVDECPRTATITEFYERENDVLADSVCGAHTGRFMHLWRMSAQEQIIGQVHVDLTGKGEA